MATTKCYGFKGIVAGSVANAGLARHYCKVFKAEHIAMLHPFQIAIYEEEPAKLRGCMIMGGQMRKYNYERYNEQLKSMPEPVMASELPKVRLNLKGIREYARKKGVSIASLTDEEKLLFISRKPYDEEHEAIIEAIRICKDRNVLREYFSSKESEAVDIMMVLYDEEEIMRSYVGLSVEEVEELVSDLQLA